MPHHKPLLGIALMLIAVATLASKDGLAKSFLDQVGPVQMIWIQFVGTFLFMALITLPRYGRRVFQVTPLPGQFVRGALNSTAIASLYWSLTYIPLADATAMFMFAPAVVTLFSPVLLGERLGVRRIAAVAIGFLGVVTILKPGFSGDPIGYYIGLMSGILMGGYFIANRKLAGAQPPLLNVTHNALMGAIALTPFFHVFWQPIPATAAPFLIALVAFAVVGQGLLITSFNYAPAVVLSPYAYAFIIFATLIGYFVFGDIPDVFTWIGMGLIFCSGVYIAVREIQLAKIAARRVEHARAEAEKMTTS